MGAVMSAFFRVFDSWLRIQTRLKTPKPSGTIDRAKTTMVAKLTPLTIAWSPNAQ